MKVVVLAAVSIALSTDPAFGQDLARSALSRQTEALAELRHVTPWPHIGAPPARGSAAARQDEWHRETDTFNHAFGAIKRSWAGVGAETGSDLRIRVRQYEDLIKAATDAGGYGNLVLADALRNLSIALLAQYVVAHPSDYGIVDDLLHDGRVRLFDCRASQELIEQELNIAPPAGGWHLSERWEDLNLVFRGAGKTLVDETAKLPYSVPGISKLLNGRDVTGLLLRIRMTEASERVNLTGLVDFLKLGGKLDDINPKDTGPYLRVMEREELKYRYPGLGKFGLSGMDLYAIIEAVRSAKDQPVPFSMLVLE